MDPLDITDKQRLLEMLAQHRRGQARVIDQAEMRAALGRRVQGQDAILDDVSKLIRLQWGKQRRDKPIANLLFVGPPATGKTELAKALAAYLFGDEQHMLRLDCAEFSGPEGKTRLIGTPTGYVGAQQGGQLTRPLFSNPRRLILFDEIEKAYAGVFDLLLSLMGEGRLTEQGSGRVADFTQSVIVLTSNVEHERLGQLREQIDDSRELASAVRSALAESRVFRPEIVSRFDQIYVFQPLDDATRARVAGLKVAQAGEEFGVAIRRIDPQIVFEIVTEGEAEQDARELRRRVDDRLGEVLLAAREQGYRCVAIDLDADGKPVVSQVVDEA